MWRNKRLAALIAVASVILVDVVPFATSHPDTTSAVKSDLTEKGIINQQLIPNTELAVPNETTDLKEKPDTTENIALELSNCWKNTTFLVKTFHRVNISCLSEFQESLNKFDFTTDFVERGTFNSSLSQGVHKRPQLNECKYINKLLMEETINLKKKCLLFRQKNPEPEYVRIFSEHFKEDSGNKQRDYFLNACYKNHVYKVIFLHDNGVDIDVKIRNQLIHTCLSIAAQYNYEFLTRVLINLGCDIDSRNVLGQTALFFSMSSLGVLELLLDNGADVNAVSKHNLTPLDLSYFPSTEVLNLLKKYGAKEYRSLN